MPVNGCKGLWGTLTALWSAIIRHSSDSTIDEVGRDKIHAHNLMEVEGSRAPDNEIQLALR